jgi:hypothetical protein
MTLNLPMTRSTRAGALALAALCVLAWAEAGCGRKKKSAATVQAERAEAAAQVEGLGALPSDVHVVVGANVPMLAASPVVRRAFASMVERDSGLAGRIAELQARCKIDPAKDLSSVVVGLLGSTSQRDVVLVAKGHFDEAAIAACVGSSLGERGGSLEKKAQAGVTIYLVHNSQGGGGDVAFTFGAPDVLVVADSETLLLRARDPAAPKLTGNAAMMKLVKATDSRAALWGAGTIAPEVGAGLVKASGDKVKQPASAMYGFANLDSGLAVELALQMASNDDARGLYEVVQKQLAQFSIMAQAYSLGPVVNKIKPAAQGSLFVVTLSLDGEELARLESLLNRPLDSKGPHGATEQGKEGTSP